MIVYVYLEEDAT